MKKTLAAVGLFLYMACLAVPTVYYLSACFNLFKKNNLLMCLLDRNIETQDFVHYYILGQMAASPDAHSVYNAAVQCTWFHKLVLENKGLVTNQEFWTLFSPMVFPFCLPMAYMSLDQAYIAFVVLCAISLTVFFPLAVNALGKRSLFCNVAIIFCAIGNIQGVMSISKGQPAFLLLALESLFFYGWVKKIDWLTGMSIGILFFKPHYALFFLTPVIVARRWKAFLACSGTAGLIAILGGLLIGFDNVINFPSIITHNDIGSCHGMVSLRFFASQVLGDLQALHLSLGIMLAGLSINLLMWWNGLKKGLDQTWLICCTVLLCLLTSPHTFHYDLVMLCLLVVSIVPAKIQYQKLAKISYAIYRALLIAYPAISWLFPLVFASKNKISSPYDPIQSVISISLSLILLALALICLFDKEAKPISE
ncbi:hypothetical protein BH11CYA1_BH11CYA1_33860 [soil metagenome]